LALIDLRQRHIMRANDSFHIAAIAGDGIGPEVMAPALEVLSRIEAATPGLKFRFTEAPAGAGHYRDTGQSLPESTVKLRRDADAIVLGACGAHRGGRRSDLRRRRQAARSGRPRWDGGGGEGRAGGTAIARHSVGSVSGGFPLHQSQNKYISLINSLI
jgi:hypothetical protein